MTGPKLTVTINLLIVCTILVALSHVTWLFPEPLLGAVTPTA